MSMCHDAIWMCCDIESFKETFLTKILVRKYLIYWLQRIMKFLKTDFFFLLSLICYQRQKKKISFETFIILCNQYNL